MRTLPAALLMMLAASTAQATEDLEWNFDLSGRYTEQEYAKGTLTTWEARLSPSVSIGNLQMYLDAPYYAKEADFSGVTTVYGPRGRPLGQLTISRKLQAEGLGDVVAGGTYHFPLNHDALSLSTDLAYKTDSGDAARLLGSGSRDLNLSLSAAWRIDRLTLSSVIGHTWVDSTPGAQDALFWEAAARCPLGDQVSLTFTWSDQDAPYAGAADQGLLQALLEWNINTLLTVQAGYGQYQADNVAGQPRTESRLGLVWRL